MERNYDRNNTPILIIVAILILVAFLAFTYNSLVNVREDVNLARSNVESAMQARLEKIPDLVATVKAYTTHEEKIFEELASAREALAASLSSGDLSAIDAADKELSIKLNNLIGLAEDNPEIQAGQQYTALMDQIEGAVNRITQARREYNSAVNAYNRKISQFPCNIYAAIFGFERLQEFTADDAAHQTNVVDFGS